MLNGVYCYGLGHRSAAASAKPEYVNPHFVLDLGGCREYISIRGRKGHVIQVMVPTGAVSWFPEELAKRVVTDKPDLTFSRLPRGQRNLDESVVRVISMEGSDRRLIQIGVPGHARDKVLPKCVFKSPVKPVKVPKQFSDFVGKNLVPRFTFQDLKQKKEEEMLTLKVESDGSQSDLQQIVSLAFNTGMHVVATLPDGTVVDAKPEQVLGDVGGEVPAGPTTPVETAEVTGVVDEPHPVFEKADLTDTVGVVQFVDGPPAAVEVTESTP